MLIYRDLLFIYPEVKKTDDLFLLFSQVLKKKGWVKNDFYTSLIKRENDFPTGLDTGRIKIAIPHTDTRKVIVEGMAVAVLKNPLTFGEMGNPGNKISIKIVFLLLLKNNKAKFYSNLLNKIQNSDILLKIYEADSRQNLCRLLTRLLDT